MAWREFTKKIRRQFSDFLEIPSELAMDLPKIVMEGNVRLFVENHRGIIEYNSLAVRLNLGESELKITGEDLILRNISSDEIVVEGNITGLKFV